MSVWVEENIDWRVLEELLWRGEELAIKEVEHWPLNYFVAVLRH